MLESFNDIFKPQEDKELKRIKDEADRILLDTASRARTCLSHNDFKTYRDSYKRSEEAIVDAMIAYTTSFSKNDNGDVSKYAFTIMRYLTKLQDLKSLLQTIESQAKRVLK